MDPRARKVSSIMSRDVATLRPDEHLDLAEDVMRLGRVRHMPVTDADGRIVGMVSHRDLLGASLTRMLEFEAQQRRSFLRSVSVEEAMATEITRVTPDTPLAEAAALLVERRIGALPVAGPDGELVGLVTETDLLRAAYLDGGRAAGTREGYEVSDLFREELEALKRARDELRVQIHLGAAEAKDLWDRLEHKWNEVESKAKLVAREAEEPMHEIGDAAKDLLREIKSGYEKIREAL